MSFFLSSSHRRKSRIRRAHLPPLSPPAAPPFQQWPVSTHKCTQICTVVIFLPSRRRLTSFFLACAFQSPRPGLGPRLTERNGGGERNSPATSFSFHLPLSLPLSLSLSLSLSLALARGSRERKEEDGGGNERRKDALSISFSHFDAFSFFAVSISCCLIKGLLNALDLEQKLGAFHSMTEFSNSLCCSERKYLFCILSQFSCFKNHICKYILCAATKEGKRRCHTPFP